MQTTLRYFLGMVFIFLAGASPAFSGSGVSYVNAALGDDAQDVVMSLSTFNLGLGMPATASVSRKGTVFGYEFVGHPIAGPLDMIAVNTTAHVYGDNRFTMIHFTPKEVRNGFSADRDLRLDLNDFIHSAGTKVGVALVKMTQEYKGILAKDQSHCTQTVFSVAQTKVHGASCVLAFEKNGSDMTFVELIAVVNEAGEMAYPLTVNIR